MDSMRRATASSAIAGASCSTPTFLSIVAGGGMSESGMRAQMQSLDSNLGALCEHVQVEGWNSRAFSDIIVQAMGTTFYLHRLLLSRSSYFRNMLQGPWKEAQAPEVRLQIDDENVNGEAIATALSYLYGHHPKLDGSNAFRVLAAASFLDLQDLCAFCTDFIISELWTENFLSYQAFAESQDYGIHGERVRKACWGYLCRGGAVELREILPKLSTQTLRTLLTSDELWVPNEEKRFELAMSVLIARGVLIELDDDLSDAIDSCSLSETQQQQLDIDGSDRKRSTLYGNFFFDLEEKLQSDVIQTMQSIVLDIADSAVKNSHQTSAVNQSEYTTESHDVLRSSDDDPWRSRDYCYMQPSSASARDQWMTRSSPCASPTWGGRVVGRRSMKAYPINNDWASNEEWDTFISVFEGGGIHYCHIPFEELLETRARLEEMGFPCKSVADGLWLQTLLRQQVLTIAADTCRLCSVTCVHGRIASGESPSGSSSSSSYGLTENQSSSSSHSRGGHVRVDGLAGIGRGGQSGTPWPSSSRFMFSRVPYGSKVVYPHEMVGGCPVDGVVVGLTQGLSTGVPVQSDQTETSTKNGVSMSGAGECSPSIGDSGMPPVGWETCSSSISLDLHTPLRNLPPFRFGVEFEDVQRLGDGQAKHSPEVFYAGSLWKVSVQAFSGEDPRGRRTLGLFLHRRKADDSGPHKKVSLYIDSREKVRARYQLICPAKKGVTILGSLTQAGTLLPKAPKGWGWRIAFLFDELGDVVQDNVLRVAAVVQLV